MSRSSPIDAKDVRFDLGRLYQGVNDPQIHRDLQKLKTMAKAFCENHRGRLHRTLAHAMAEYLEYQRLKDKILLFARLVHGCDTSNEEANGLLAGVLATVRELKHRFLFFLEREVAELSSQRLQSLIRSDRSGLLRLQRSFLMRIRREARYNLAADVRSALGIADPFSSRQWSDAYRQAKSELQMRVWPGGRLRTISEVRQLADDDTDSERRFAALRALNSSLGSKLAPLMCHAFNSCTGEWMVHDQAQGYRYPREEMDRRNQLPRGVVDGMLSAVQETGGRLTRRFYSLIRRLSGRATLHWSDLKENPFGAALGRPTWTDTVQTVFEAFGSFSPLLGCRAERVLEEGRIDAASEPHKLEVAFCHSAVMPEPLGSQVYVFLHYAGGTWAQRTLAHELGHGGQEELAGEDYGPLLQRSVPGISETAATFGEVLYFEHLLSQTTSKEQRLGLLLNRCQEFVYVVIWMACLAAMEQKAYAARRKGPLTVSDLNSCWLSSARDFFGGDGEIFSYEDTESLWVMIHHLLMHGFLYSYPFGSLLSLALYEVKREHDLEGISGRESFVRAYLSLLRAGASRSPLQLVSRFGLKLRDARFWSRTIKGTFGKWIAEAERLASG